MKIARLILSAVLGVIVTFGLLVLMYSLIESAQQAPDESATRKIADIWQTEREITDQLKELKPEKPEDPDEPPPDLPDEKVDLEARLVSHNRTRMPLFPSQNRALSTRMTSIRKSTYTRDMIGPVNAPTVHVSSNRIANEISVDM